MQVQLIKNQQLRSFSSPKLCQECSLNTVIVKDIAVATIYIGKIQLHLCARHFRDLAEYCEMNYKEVSKI